MTTDATDATAPDASNQKHAIRGRLHFDLGSGGLTRGTLTHHDATAQVYLHGAHVTHYQPAHAQPVLFMSQASHFAPQQPIRGGVPICFPWFGPKADDPDAPAHGLARTRPWHIHSASADDHATTLTLANDSIAPFHVTLRIELCDRLRLTLSVQNTGHADASYQVALHTYLILSDARKVTVTGLEHAAFIDKMNEAREFPPTGEPIRFTAETDRVYLDTDDSCIIHDAEAGRRIIIDKEGASHTVIWNPWIDKAARMPDFGDHEWPGMCCVETANVHADGITLPPGQSHDMTAIIRCEAI